ncbi:MAG: DUF4384 domain-containing protein [Candidatus Eisenbacteria bacterium]|nr:DUF4384 domain-containing protein [Candidatus Eisenbacteria bacterium]
MTDVLRNAGERHIFWTTLLTLLVLLSLSVASPAAEIAVEEARPERDGGAAVPRDDGEARERVVVVPEPSWDGWDDWGHGRPWHHHGAPRVQLWVDRGPWGVYAPGDPLWVFFRVDRSCHVTIIDYATDGSVRVLFPNRWSGSSFVHPGRTYRIPRDGWYSLRIAGPGGIETLVACAHEVPWPSGQSGAWVPPHRSRRGRVIVEGRSGPRHSPGRPGRVVTPSPRHWPVPDPWYDAPRRWSCDEISFRVAGYGWDGHGWYGGRPYGYHDDRSYEPRPDGSRRGDGEGWRLLLRDVFTIDDEEDAYFREIVEDVVLVVECVEGREGEPTEIEGRIEREDGDRIESVFRIDVEGRRGHRPDTDRVYKELLEREGVRLEMRVVDFSTERPGRWDSPVIRWIRFEVDVLED